MSLTSIVADPPSVHEGHGAVWIESDRPLDRSQPLLEVASKKSESVASGAERVSQSVTELETLWRDSLGNRLQAEVIATAAE